MFPISAISGVLGGVTGMTGLAGRAMPGISDAASGISGAAGGMSGGLEGVASGAIGLGEIIAGIIKNKKANNAGIPLSDPAQTAFLSEINMKRKNLGYSGADYGAGITAVNQNLSGALDSISKVNTGNAGAIIAGLSGAQSGANAGVNSIVGGMATRDNFYTTIAQSLTDKIAQRKFDLQMYDKLRNYAQGSELINSGVDNFGSAVGSISKLAMLF